MKKITVAFLLLGAWMTNAQDVQEVTKRDSVKTTSIDSLKEVMNNHSAKFDGYDERLSEIGGILDKLSKIKISGYIQAQYEMYDLWSADGQNHGVNVGTATAPDYVTNSFFIRRARVKFTYEALDGVKFVLCPNFDIDRVTIKDAYVVLNDRWTNTYSLWVGQFNRPTYEIEYSSASREFAERSLMTRTLYPTERELGAKLEADFNTKYNFPLKLQLAVLNGNFGEGAASNQVKDVDNGKDFMARATYAVKMAEQGLGIDFGAHTYLGNTTVISQTIPPAEFSDVNNSKFAPVVGDKFKKELFGGEMQVYYDFLGGMSLKSEYIRGTYSGTTNAAQVNSLFNANKVRNVEGYYISLVKNVGSKHVASARYDVFDPNTKLSGDDVTTRDDLKYNTWTFAWQYYFDENVKIMACYNMPINEKSANAGADYKTDKRDNTFTLRLQASF